MEVQIREVFDTEGTLRCVRFASGRVGVVDDQGKVVLRLNKFQRVEFAAHGFLKVTNVIEFFVDRKNGEIYAHMPELIRLGEFEIASIGGFLCTRTRKLYEVRAFLAEAWLGKPGWYLVLPHEGEPSAQIKRWMIGQRTHYEVCLLRGDERGVYWLMRVFADCSLLVMDDKGNYLHACWNAKSGKVVRRRLGKVDNEADRLWMAHVVQQIEEPVAERLQREAVKKIGS